MSTADYDDRWAWRMPEPPRLPPMLEITVHGTPGPQGSKNVVHDKKGRAHVYESSRNVAPWRDAVAAAARAALLASVSWEVAPHDPVVADLTFILKRPASVKPAARPWPSVKPDLDKYERATLDALVTAGALVDDGQVIRLVSTKVYAFLGQPAGATIRLTNIGGM